MTAGIFLMEAHLPMTADVLADQARTDRQAAAVRAARAPLDARPALVHLPLRL